MNRTSRCLSRALAVVPAVVLTVTLAGTLGLAGCGVLATKTGPADRPPTLTGAATPSDRASTARPSAPSTTAPDVPGQAAFAGGACLLLDFNVIRSVLGTAFDVAAAADTGGTYSCVVQGTAASHPDMALSITATDLTAAEFKANAQPDGARPVTALGTIGYEIRNPAPSGAGPVIEVGWLSGNDRLIVLRYTCATNVSAAAVAALEPKMIKMAQTVDATTV